MTQRLAWKRRILLLVTLAALPAAAQEAPSIGAPPPASHASAVPEDAPAPPPPMPQPQHDDSAMFEQTLPPDAMQFLLQFDGAPAHDLMTDKRFRKLLRGIVPDCTFHYGRDMSLDDALDMVMKDSRIPVRLRAGRYLLVAGSSGPYLGGRAFLWLDLQQGIGLGAFYFRPTNGELSPSLVVFSRQIGNQPLDMGALPAEFVRDAASWDQAARVEPVTARYFITGDKNRLLLEHDEDFCAPADGTIASNDCEQQNADAADLDMNAAYYLDQVHYATNATAWMIGPDQRAFITFRDRSCGGAINVLPCRIRLTRERTQVILKGHPVNTRR